MRWPIIPPKMAHCHFSSALSKRIPHPHFLLLATELAETLELGSLEINVECPCERVARTIIL